MADGFEQMIHDARTFFTELSKNNTRAWFDANKTRYTEGIKKPAEFFADLIAEDIARISGDPVQSKVFRIYRDVRFSKDKTPYNTHLHMMWKPVADKPLTPSWFFGLGTDYFIFGLGLMGLQGESLARYRAFVDRNGEALQDAIDASGAQISDWGPAPLKRVPKPYEADHPQAALLKRKALAVTTDMASDWEAQGLVKAANAQIAGLLPVYRVWMS